jgi:hypothetical protein
MRKYIGIDLGKKGAYYILGEDGSELDRGPTPMISKEIDWHAFNKILAPYEMFNGMVVFEKIGIIQGSSKATAFSMGGQLCAIQMCCIANDLIYTMVPPKKWQAEIFDGQTKIYKSGSKTKIDTKAMALIAAKRLFPKVNLLMTEKSSVPHDGLVDALLIAEYARRKFPR